MGWIAYQNVSSLSLFGIVSMVTLPKDLRIFKALHD